jgi:hypothetical protein
MKEAAIAAEAMNRAHDRLNYWRDRAPAALRDAIAGAGMIVPVSQMSLGEVIALLDLFAAEGPQPAIQRVHQHYDELFANVESVVALCASWSRHPILARREDVLRQALEAHTRGLYALVVPVLIAQAEGIVADLAGHAGPMGGGPLKQHVERLAARDRWTELMISAFWKDVLLERFEHGDPAPPLSRHAILHGGDTRYGTERNSQTTILLIDHLRLLAEGSDDPDDGPPPSS